MSPIASSAARRRVVTPSTSPASERAAMLCRAFVTTVLVGALLACSDRPPSGIVQPPPDRSQLAAFVTADVAASLGADGKFDVVASVTGGKYAELSAAQANQLAAVWTRQFGPLFTRYLEEGHGHGPINFRSLAVCGRTLYARSAFEPASEEIPSPYRRPYGPWWLVTLCTPAGTPSVSLAVSAWATDLTIVNGKIQFPSFAGNEFFPIGIPNGHVGEFPSSPELAVTLASQQSGRRVAARPELIMPVNTDGPPQASRWRISLDSVATLRGSRTGDVVTNTLFVAPPRVTERGLMSLVASPSQPVQVEFSWSPAPHVGEQWKAYEQRMNASINTAIVRRRADTPLKLEFLSTPGGR